MNRRSFLGIAAVVPVAPSAWTWNQNPAYVVGEIGPERLAIYDPRTTWVSRLDFAEFTPEQRKSLAAFLEACKTETVAHVRNLQARGRL